MAQPAVLGDSFVGWFIGGDRSWTFTVPFIGWRLEGCVVFLAVMALTILLLTGVGVALSRKRELHRQWTTWAIIIPTIGIPIWIGRGTTALLTTLPGLRAIRKLARMTRLPRPEAILLCILAVLYPLTAWQRPNIMAFTPVVVLVCVLPTVVTRDMTDGVHRVTLTDFASIWIPWSLTHLAVLWHDAFLIAFATTAADVTTWAGRTGLERFAWARRLLSPLLPDKTVGGLVGALTDVVVILTFLGHIALGLVVAIGVGGVLGDLLGSMVKRAAGVEDAGDWLPGFGGLLNHVGFLLLILPLTAVLG